ncbi:interleukin-27 subunit alpha isoform X1 [Ahaetulla prasina]|uniref:interleukin-27 subunit alpha isoform X1 n=1 Tax=Ahaetulla prasina TaxID=499056 RepID=UPI0026494BA8|nr:interleukin-27 subunit alpha isoform X1 [Ahaetulla prasina]
MKVSVPQCTQNSAVLLLLLQVLLKFDILLAAPSIGLQEEKGSGLETIPEKKLDLQKEFSMSLKLTRQLLHKTKDLTRYYLLERLPGVEVPLISHLGRLPSTSLDFHTWISLSDARRLLQIAKTVSFYHKLVHQLRNFEAIKENSKFSSQFEDIDVNLRDLGHQVDYQITLWGLSSDIQPISTPQILQYRSQWRNRQEVYIVLRSLESFLVRVARDFLMLRLSVPKVASPSKIF